MYSDKITKITPELIDSDEFRDAYQNFYAVFRQYLWPFDIVVLLADIEVSLFDTFIDREKSLNLVKKFRSQINDVCREDKELDEALNYLQEILEYEDKSQFIPLYKVEEVTE